MLKIKVLLPILLVVIALVVGLVVHLSATPRALQPVHENPPPAVTYDSTPPLGGK